MPEQVIIDEVVDAEVSDADEEVITCDHCSATTGTGGMWHHSWRHWQTPHTTEQHPCEVCAEAGHDVDEHDFCEHCDEHVADDHRCTCYCGRLREECGYCDGCDEPRCECDCNAEDGEYVHDWDYQPEEILWYGMVDGKHTTSQTQGRDAAHAYRAPHDTQPYLGIEVETEAMGCSPRDIAEIWTDNGMGWCKTDGSLSSQGVECVSFPHTYERLEGGTLETVLVRMKRIGARSWEPGHCGLHIHVSRPSFSGKPHQWRFAAAHEAMSKELRTMSGRGGEEGYCKWDSTTYMQKPVEELTAAERDYWHKFGDRPYVTVKATAKKIIAGKQQNEDRYVSVNVTKGTIELRFWRGSLTPTHVLGAAALADGIQQWTRDMSVPTVRRDLTGSHAKAWEAFQAWAAEHLPTKQVKRIYALASRRDVPVLPALIEAAAAAEGGDA